MAEKSLPVKMKLKPNLRAAVIQAPEGYLSELNPLPDGVEISQQLGDHYDWIQVFVRTKAELDSLVPKVVESLKEDSQLWISFPKGTSKIQTDLTRDKGWDALRWVDLKWTNLISLNDTWSAFSFRPYKPGEKKESPMAFRQG